MDPAGKKTFLEVTDSQPAWRGQGDQGKKGGGEESFNNGDVPVTLETVLTMVTMMTMAASLSNVKVEACTCTQTHR